jgi:uncharacterized damage-inducible protein DinB
MTQTELIILHLTEIRRRSTLLWKALHPTLIDWKPDEQAMSAIEMIRHVLEADYGWNKIIQNESMAHYQTPWKNRPFISVEDELDFANPYRTAFLETIRQFSDKELDEKEVIHPGNNGLYVLGNYILRIGYHESVHAGQFLSYLRAMNVKRPVIWD